MGSRLVLKYGGPGPFKPPSPPDEDNAQHYTSADPCPGYGHVPDPNRMKYKDGTEFGYDIKHRVTTDEVFKMFAEAVNYDWAQNESTKFYNAFTPMLGDEIWWYSGPWSFLAGVEGYCIVRKGVVVHYVHTKMS